MDTEDSFSLKKIQSSYENFMKNVTFTPLTGVKMLYRKCPIHWGKLRYLSMPCPTEATLGRVGISEHNFIGLVTDNDVVENNRYNEIILNNIKFSLFMRMAELSRSITGYSQNPFVKAPCRQWTSSWEFLTKSTTDLNDWMKIVSYHTNLDVEKFFSRIYCAITAYAKNTMLDDVHHWRAIGDEATHIDHLRNYIGLMGMSYNLQNYAYSKLWYHHIRLQGDFCKLAMQVLKK